VRNSRKELTADYNQDVLYEGTQAKRLLKDFISNNARLNVGEIRSPFIES
jgi:hypothetical protein